MEGVDKQALLAVLLMERALRPGYLSALFGGSTVESDGQRENSGANCLPHTWHMVGAQDMSATKAVTIVPTAGRVKLQTELEGGCS